jgi:glycerol-3-phosphate dehydrogenase
MNTQPNVIVIGAGFTGCAVAHDLALRGLKVTVVDRGEIASGTSGRTHGLLHSGGRYCVTDPEAAIECIQENITLRKIAKQCIEFNGGLFVALNEDDLIFSERFAASAENCGIPIESLSSKKVLELEPNLNPGVLTAFTVPDGTFDPLRLALAFAAHAVSNGASFFPHHEVKSLKLDGKGNVIGVIACNRHENRDVELFSDIVINATGAWAGDITAMAGARVPVIPTPGVMVAYDQRLIQRVINRLNEPGDGDILIPQRRMMVIGTTSFEVEDVNYIPIDKDQVLQMRASAIELVPMVKKTRERGAYMSARPLIKSNSIGRSLSRTFKCFDHLENEGINGIVTITGGKATTCRAMAETTANIVCKKLGINVACITKEVVLTSYRNFYRP